MFSSSNSGGDNLGVYLPFFATHPPRARLVIIVVFLFMIAVWCFAARWLAHHKLLLPVIRTWDSKLLPLALILLGHNILLQHLNLNCGRSSNSREGFVHIVKRRNLPG